MSIHYRVHEAADKFIGPYNARQRSSSYPYQAPDRDVLKEIVRRGDMNEFSYMAFLNGLIRFCEQHKGNRALPTPHPSTIHSIQLPQPAFEIKGDQIWIAGADSPLTVKGLRDPDTVRFIIVRPKLSQLGTASAKNWEVLFYRTALGYIPDWADSNLNPRYSGIY